ncbi:MAG TPA: hypothetical protein VF939_21705 [Puia sp.]
MQLHRILSVLVIFAGPFIPAPVSAQKQKTPVNVNSLFADLPIDDAAGNSALSNGESGEEKIKKNIFIIGSLNKSVCYSGEPLLLTYQLYSALQSKSLVTEKPGLGNFNVEERPLNNERPLLKRKEGKGYRVFTIWQVQLNPFQPGDLTIDPLSVSNEVSYASDNQTHSYSGIVNSNKIVLTVLPLPAYQGVEIFSGAIGKFSFRAFVVSNRIAAGETDSLCLEIEGAGNLNAITLPAIKWPAGVEIFPFKEKWVSVKNAFPPAGKKTVNIPFVAHHAGHFSIPSVRWAYFDPSLKGYRELQSGAIDLDILPVLAGSGEKKPAVLPPPVVNGADYSWVLWSLGALSISVLAFWWLRRRSHPYMGAEMPVSSPIGEAGALAGGAVGFGDAASGQAGEMSAAERDAFLAANARRELEELRGLQDKEQYIIKVKAILSGFLQESWPTSGISGDELADSLYRNTQDQALVEDVRNFYSRCDRLLYAPSDLAEVDASLAGMVSLIIERCEIHKNINR